MIFSKLKIGRNFLLILVLTACAKEPSHLHAFFKKLESEIINESILEDISTYSKDSLALMLPIFRIECNELLEDLHYNQELQDLIDSSSVSPFSHLREQMLLFAFQKHLNKQTIDLDKIIYEIQQAEVSSHGKMLRDEELHKKELTGIIIANDLKWRAGDTLNLILQVDNNNTIYYRSYPGSLDYSFADDTLRMKGILISKYYSKVSGYETAKLSDPLNLVFKLRILELSNAEARNPVRKLEVGDKFVLSLEAYGRPIE